MEQGTNRELAYTPEVARATQALYARVRQWCRRSNGPCMRPT